MTNIGGFAKMAEDLEDFADEIREDNPTGQRLESRGGVRKGQFDSTHEAIQDAINDVMEQVVTHATGRAIEHVGRERAETIDHEPIGWTDGYTSYEHRFYSENDIVTYHEFGTGTRAEHPFIQGTVNAEQPSTTSFVTQMGTPDRETFEGIKRGYLIESPTGPVDFFIDGQRITLEYVVHPGVHAQHFMKDTLDDFLPRIKRKAAKNLDRRFENLN